MIDLPMYSKDDRYPKGGGGVFANGTEHEMWLEQNCARGERGCRHYRPDATSSRNGCPIEVAIALAGGTDGCIPARIALRGGFLREGAAGLLTDAHLWPTTSDGFPAYAPPLCPEFKGYDEPDDRPRRGPRPPKGQLDLLDPRSTPGRVREKI